MGTQSTGSMSHKRIPARLGLVGIWLASATLALTLCACAGHRNIRATSRSSFPAPAQVSRPRLQRALHAYYRKWRGVPYRYGGQSDNGIDCSSFVQQTLDSVESLRLPRTTAAQARRGHPVARSELAPGDLVFFRTGGGYRHVGIYVGDARFMHASTSHGVTVSALDSRYWRRHYWQARRLAR